MSFVVTEQNFSKNTDFHAKRDIHVRWSFDYGRVINILLHFTLLISPVSLTHVTC